MAAVNVWEEANGPFLYGGERYFDRIAAQEETYLEIRDSLRNARKKKDGKLESSFTQPLTKTATAT